jgi:type I restriction enzyme M protein
MVEKTSKGEKAEVQEGWKGRILPFALVQSFHHRQELDAIREKETRLSEISASIEEALEGLSEEDKETASSDELLTEEGDKFVSAAVAKEAKRLQAGMLGTYAPETYEAKIVQVAEWQAEEKTLKAALKKETDALHLKTKKTIEGLTDKQVHELLEAKWITPLFLALYNLCTQQTDRLTRKLEALVEKYRLTYADNAREIQQAETALAGMIGDLDANEFDLQGLTELKTLLAAN